MLSALQALRSVQARQYQTSNAVCVVSVFLSRRKHIGADCQVACIGIDACELTLPTMGMPTLPAKEYPLTQINAPPLARAAAGSSVERPTCASAPAAHASTTDEEVAMVPATLSQAALPGILKKQAPLPSIVLQRVSFAPDTIFHERRDDRCSVCGVVRCAECGSCFDCSPCNC